MQTQRVALCLLPGFSLQALAGVHDALTAANELLDDCQYELRLLGGGLVAATGGARVATVSPDLEADAPWAAAFLLGSPSALEEGPVVREWQRLCRRWAAQGAVLAGVDGGASVLASLGLLDGQRACASWALLDTLAHRHPGVAWAQGLWEISLDGRWLTAAGGGAALDLTAAWLVQRHGERLGPELAWALGVRGFRGRDERQRALEPRANHPKLAEALALMEANLGEPLPTEDIARLVGVSRRQLERVFKQHLGVLPLRHYLDLRLQRARRLLQQSSQSILQIGLSCGFSSGPHFSNAYRAHFGHTPRDERRLRGAGAEEIPTHE
ncbi:GlxA family transcriptional regulator [Inhella gelatinilytica]|uniref:Helix-turn-helix domain-containing protein n=1 Tax=Inhella gelatinilytica TaxID=2795030 RepID=A0A931ND54_9BURK|nr:helix-turn-helix domain-containing protein [Inhella gelatinilytica]MBH9552244.1 helix-turn-helix domain-containing protein [Inhella gelatinilytica]